MFVGGRNKRSRDGESESGKEEDEEAVVAVTVTEKPPLIKVAAICGSLRKASFNRGLIRAAIELAKEQMEGVHVEYIEISELPMLNTDLEAVEGSYPAVVEAFRQKVLEADSFLFASPDYNYSVTPPLKNALDWGSRPPNVWAGKAAAAVSAVGGGRRAQLHLRQIGVFLGLHFINKPEFYLNAHRPPGKFNINNGDLVDPETKDKLQDMLLSLQAFTLALLQGTFSLAGNKHVKFSWKYICLCFAVSTSARGKWKREYERK